MTRQQVVDFLIAEADLLDNWRLREWLALFDPEATGYFMPTTDLPDGDPGADLHLIAEDMTILGSGVDQLLSRVIWHEALAQRFGPEKAQVVRGGAGVAAL